ncbi:MAG TPA: glycine oxidase ThiO [Terriglobales bacterium]|nr:glycine oxidase ThiO [Terriglobales bacterium]
MKKTWDVIVIGAGVIGVSLAWMLRKEGAAVLILERNQPGREASHAAAGMLAYCDPHIPKAVQPLIRASARLYPEFVHELQDESGENADLRSEGAIILGAHEKSLCPDVIALDAKRLEELEPHLAHTPQKGELWPEKSVDPRALFSAVLKAAKHRGVDVSSGERVTEVLVEDGRATGVLTSKTRFAGNKMVNCAGAWATEVKSPVRPVPTRPVKGQMLSLVWPDRQLLRHVVRAPNVYLVPRSDGRIFVGTTVEDVGFDKRTEPETIQRFHQAAANLIPELGQARMLEDWAGLRPGTPDDMPILGETELPGYFVAAGHFRDGILLAPITAKLMTQLLTGEKSEIDIAPFSPARFGLR